jgi:uncharacterized protein YxeA
MKKKLLTIVIIGGILAFLYTTNPTQDDFMSYVEKQVKEAKGRKEDSLKKFLVGLDDEAKTLAFKEGTTRKDYYFFSIFEVSDSEGNHLHKVIGFAQKIFLPLNPGQKDKFPNIN